MRPYSARPCASWRSRDEAAHVVGEIGEADLYSRPSYADGLDEESYQPLFMREHMFDRAAHFRLLHIGDARALGHRLALRLLAVNARHKRKRTMTAAYRDLWKFA